MATYPGIIATPDCPPWAPFFGMMGITFAMVFCSAGAAYGTAKSGMSISSMGVFKPELIMKALIPVVMAGIVAIYGLVVAVLIADELKPKGYTITRGAIHLSAGMSVGFAGLSAGYAIGVIGQKGILGYSQQPRLFVGMVLMLIFAEVLGLYGLIIALILKSRATAATPL